MSGSIIIQKMDPGQQSEGCSGTLLIGYIKYLHDSVSQERKAKRKEEEKRKKKKGFATPLV